MSTARNALAASLTGIAGGDSVDEALVRMCIGAAAIAITAALVVIVMQIWKFIIVLGVVLLVFVVGGIIARIGYTLDRTRRRIYRSRNN